MPTAWKTNGGALSLAGILCALLAGGCASSERRTPALEDVTYEIDRWAYAGHPGRQLTTHHYEIYTTLNDEVLLKAVPQVVESAYLYYRELVPSARAPNQRMKVYLFARRDEWANFTRHFAGPRAKTLLKVQRGGYMERGITVAEYVAHSITFPLLTHEGFHQYVFHCVPGRMPAWLNEGLATICEGQRWSNAGLKEFDPWHNPGRRNALAEVLLRDEAFPLGKLLEINAGDVVGGSTRAIGAYYAQLWQLMLFLNEGQEGKYAESFARLLDAIGSQDLEAFARAAHVKSTHSTYNFGRDLFCAFISDDLEAVEREYVTFMRRKILGER
jgi:hypothetical protein